MNSLEKLTQRKTEILKEIARLGPMRRGSVTDQVPDGHAPRRVQTQARAVHGLFVQADPQDLVTAAARRQAEGHLPPAD